MANPGIELEGSYRNTKNSSNVDWWYGGGDAAWGDLSTATNAIPTNKRLGLTIGIVESDAIVEYWWPTSVSTSGDPILKQTSSGGGAGTASQGLYKTEENDFQLGVPFNSGENEFTESREINVGVNGFKIAPSDGGYVVIGNDFSGGSLGTSSTSAQLMYYKPADNTSNPIIRLSQGGIEIQSTTEDLSDYAILNMPIIGPSTYSNSGEYGINYYNFNPATATDNTLVPRGYITGLVSGFVPNTRTLSINGQVFDLTANRSWTITGSPSGAAGGDLTGTYPNPTVNIINGITKSFYDPTSSIQSQLNSKQVALVSGTSIKTINSQSLLGSGDITINSTPGGSDKGIQFNDGGAFNSSTNLIFDKTTSSTYVGNLGTFTAQTGTITYFGTSITAGSGATTNAFRYATLASTLLGLTENNLGSPGATVQGTGVTGGNTFLDRMSLVPTYAAGTTQWLVVECGPNDFNNYTTGGAKQPAQYETDLTTIINYFKTTKGWPASSILVLNNSYYRSDGYTGVKTPAIYASYQAKTLSVATATGCLYFDINAYFLARGADFLLADGLHPNNSGHKLQAAAVYSVLTNTNITYKNGQAIASKGLVEVDRLKLNDKGLLGDQGTTLLGVDVNGNVGPINAISLPKSSFGIQIFSGDTSLVTFDRMRIFYDANNGNTFTIGTEKGLSSGNARPILITAPLSTLTLTSPTVNVIGNLNVSTLTASKLIFTDASKNLTSTGIGTSAQFIMGDGSLNSTSYIQNQNTSSQTANFWINGAGKTDGDMLINAITAGRGTGNSSNNVVYSSGINTTSIGTFNVIFGRLNFTADATGSTANTAIGSAALRFITTGGNNTALGVAALTALTTGNGNTGIGVTALSHITTAQYNTAVGIGAGWTLVTGNQNTLLGRNAGYTMLGSGNVFLGFEAGYNETGDNKLYISNSNTATPLIYGDFNTAIATINGKLIVTTAPTGPNDVVRLSDLSGGGTAYTADGTTLTLAGTVFSLNTTYTDGRYAQLISPAFTGAPTAPTATPGTNTTQLATTAFVTAAVASGGGGGGFTNPMTTQGDIIYGGTSGIATRLAIGGANTVLHGGTIPSYSGIATGDIIANAVTYAKLQTTSVNGVLLGSPSSGSTVQEITIGSGLTLTGGVLTASGGGGSLQNLTAGTGLSGTAYNGGTAQTWTSNLSTGVAGSQSVIGGTASGETLTLSSTTNITKGKILLGTSAYDEVNNFLGIGTNAPTQALTFVSGSSGIAFHNQSDQVTNYERLRIYATSNVWTLASERGGTGTVRAMAISAGSATLTLTASTFSVVGVSSFGGKVVSGGLGNSTTAALEQFAGSTNSQSRASLQGNNATLTTNAAYANLSVTNATISTAATGTHPWLTSGAIKSMGTVTSGGATVTGTSTLYIETNSATIGTNNYTLYVQGGTNYIGGTLTLDRLNLTTGSNKAIGLVTLVGGTVTVSNTSVTSSSIIFFSRTSVGGTVGTLSYTVTAGTSFTINSSNVLDTSTIGYIIIN